MVKSTGLPSGALIIIFFLLKCSLRLFAILRIYCPSAYYIPTLPGAYLLATLILKYI